MPDTAFAASDFASGTGRRRNLISLTPLIDVVFILLVFFMLASSFLDWRAIRLDTAAATAGAPSRSDPSPLLLTVSRDELRLNGEALTQTELVERITARFRADPQAELRVRPLGDTPLQPVITAMDTLHAAGITRMRLSRDPSWTPHAANGSETLI